VAKITVNQGLQVSIDNDYGNAAVNIIDAMAVSDFGTLLAGTTSIAAATNKDANALTSSTRSGQVNTAIGDWTTGEANFAITTITLHRGGAGVFTDVYGGIDGQSLTKNSDFALKITLTDTRTSG
jgi:hypothetical protein